MRADPCHDSRFTGELAALLATKQSSDDEAAREALFAALSRLERQALIAGAADSTLEKIAEARFLVGILRDSMRPSRIAPLRSLLRLARSRAGSRKPIRSEAPTSYRAGWASAARTFPSSEAGFAEGANRAIT